MKMNSYWLFGLLLVPSLALGGGTCAKSKFAPFLGKWKGEAKLILANREPMKISKTVDEFYSTDCLSFQVKISYFDEEEAIPTRTLELKAKPKASSQDIFEVKGKITEKAQVIKMNGSFQLLGSGAMLGSFTGAVGGKGAYLSELMNISESNEKKKQLVRSVQIYAKKRGGNYIGTRVVSGSLING